MIKKIKIMLGSSKILVISLVVIFLIPFSVYGYRLYTIEKGRNETFIEYKKVDAISTNSANSDTSVSNTVATPPLPDKMALYVPFQVQAPNANWDALHEESCEETSLLMVKHYIDKTNFSPDPDNEIVSLVNWETDHGYKVDVTIEELNKIAKSYFGLTGGRVETNFTLDDIKKEIASGRPVIIPAAGRLLGNPNFSGPGPVYHNLVLTGYDKNGFITNDPGTRRGQDYRYSFDTIMNAIHDWDPKDINSGRKVYLVFDQ